MEKNYTNDELQKLHEDVDKHGDHLLAAVVALVGAARNVPGGEELLHAAIETTMSLLTALAQNVFGFGKDNTNGRHNPLTDNDPDTIYQL